MLDGCWERQVCRDQEKNKSVHTMRKRTEINPPLIVDHVDLPLYIKENIIAYLIMLTKIFIEH